MRPQYNEKQAKASSQILYFWLNDAGFNENGRSRDSFCDGKYMLMPCRYVKKNIKIQDGTTK